MVPLSAPTLGPKGAAEAALPQCLCPRTVPGGRRGAGGPGAAVPPCRLRGHGCADGASYRISLGWESQWDRRKAPGLLNSPAHLCPRRHADNNPIVAALLGAGAGAGGEAIHGAAPLPPRTGLDSHPHLRPPELGSSVGAAGVCIPLCPWARGLWPQPQPVFKVLPPDPAASLGSRGGCSSAVPHSSSAEP